MPIGLSGGNLFSQVRSIVSDAEENAGFATGKPRHAEEIQASEGGHAALLDGIAIGIRDRQLHQTEIMMRLLDVKPMHENKCQRGGAHDDPESQSLE